MTTPIDFSILQPKIDAFLENKFPDSRTIEEAISIVTSLTEQDSTFDGNIIESTTNELFMYILLICDNQNQGDSLIEKLYPPFYNFIRKSDKATFPLDGVFSQFYKKGNLLQKLTKEFKVEEKIPIAFLWKSFNAIEKDKETRQEWYKFLNDRYDVYPSISGDKAVFLLSYYLESDNETELEQYFQSIISPVLTVELNQGQISYLPFTLKFSKEVETIIKELNSGQLMQYKSKFIQVLIKFTFKQYNKPIEKLYSLSYMVSKLMTSENKSTICQLIEEHGEEIYKYQVLAFISFHTRNPSVLERVSEEYICRFLAQVGIKFIPLFFHLSKADIEEVKQSAPQSENRNKRMKYTDFTSLFRSKVDLIFYDPVAFECFMNDTKDEGFLRFDMSDWELASAEKYIEDSLKIFPRPSVFSYFLNTLTRIQYYFKQSFDMVDTYLWDHYIEKTLSLVFTNLNETAFETLRLLVVCNTITETKKEYIEKYVQVMSAAILLINNPKLVEEAVKAMQHAFGHIAPVSFSIIPYACVAFKHSSINKFIISQIISIISILVDNPKACSKKPDVVFLDLIMSRNILPEIMDEFNMIINSENPVENVMENMFQILISYCKEYLLDHVTLGILYSLLHIFKPVLTPKIKDLIMEIGKAIFVHDTMKLHYNIRHIGAFTYDYKTFSGDFPELYKLIENYLAECVLDPPLPENLATLYLETFADICLVLEDKEFLESTFAKLKQLRPYLRAIDLVHNRFLIRMNQPLCPSGVPQKRDVYLPNNNTIAATSHDSDPIQIDFATLGGCMPYSVTWITREDNTNYDSLNPAMPFPTNGKSVKNSFDSKFEDLLKLIPDERKVNTRQLASQFRLQPFEKNSSIERFNSQDKYNSLDSSIDLSDNDIPGKNVVVTSLFSTIKNGYSNASPVSNNTMLDLSAKTLFAQPLRETLKIGMLFVKDGQRDQNLILSNNWSSTEGSSFRSFALSIGRIIDLANHKWYCGKLDSMNFSNGQYHVYFESERFEVMFHCAPLLPTDDTDKQQIYKKRHIGNDNVHIVWSHHTQDYNMQTITSQFNDALVIVYPIFGSNTLFRVSVLQKDESMAFGPLHDETIITAHALPDLVRWTAIFADRVSRMSTADTRLPCELFTDACNPFLGLSVPVVEPAQELV